ncbi:MAG: hypothetical protein JSW08_00050 [archaeon]|nr:MAG: hypothetical protein JSW08_00050 [archaeon]
MTEEEIPLTPEEKKALSEYLGFGVPLPEEKHSAHSFLYRVATADDTTKVGNLKEEEVGEPKITLRGVKELALISDKIIGLDVFKDYFNQKGEIITSTSLSKDAKLINLAVIQRRQIEDLSKSERKINKGWFKPKSKEPPLEGV